MQTHPCGACWGPSCRHRYKDERQIELNDRVKITGIHPQEGIVAELRSLGNVVIDVFPRLAISGDSSLRYRTTHSRDLVFIEGNQTRVPK